MAGRSEEQGQNSGRMARVIEASAEGIAEAATALRAGQLVAFPTETVYGLGADATNPRAVAAIFAAKGRPHFNPLIAHVARVEDAYRLGVFSPLARRLAEKFWPGPLTLVVPAQPDCPVCDLARAGLASIAIRVPAHSIALQLIAAAERPIAAPSANRSGHVSPTRVEHVRADLGSEVQLVVEGGASSIGLESTILACDSDNSLVLLRSGGLPRAEIENIADFALKIADSSDATRPIAPGRLASHYAPRAHLRLDASNLGENEALLAFGPVPFTVPVGAPVVNLSEAGDLAEAASNLYLSLRKLDEGHPKTIAVMPIPKEGLGEAISDRLRRAAAPR